MRQSAGADWAFVRDSSALAIVDELEPAGDAQPLPLLSCSILREWRNDRGPRDPHVVVAEVARLLVARGLDSVCSDSYYRETVWRVLADRDVGLVAAPTSQDEIAQSYLYLRRLLHADRLRLPKHPRLRRQLVDVTAKATANAGLAIELKRRDGAHGDLVSALVLACWQLRHAPEDYSHRGIRARSQPGQRSPDMYAVQAGLRDTAAEQYEADSDIV